MLKFIILLLGLLPIYGCVYRDFTLALKPDFDIETVAKIRKPAVYSVNIISELQNHQMVGYRRFKKLKLTTQTVDEGLIYFSDMVKSSIKGATIINLEKAGASYNASSPKEIRITINDLFIRSYFGVNTTTIIKITVQILEHGTVKYSNTKEVKSNSNPFLWLYTDKAAQNKINTDFSDLISSTLEEMFAREEFIGKL
jgi:hypothetical protein